jgi:hypothetical protein
MQVHLGGGRRVQSESPENDAVFAEFPGFGSVCTSGGVPGLQNQWAKATSLSETASSANDAENLAFCLARKSPDLAKVIEAWPTLPDHIRKAILALVEMVK